MATLIAVYDSKGCRGRCDARCYNAKGDKCTCICGGLNHGNGRAKAVENTRDLAETWVEEWEKKHPDIKIERHKISDATKQQDLFDLEPFTDNTRRDDHEARTEGEGPVEST